VWKAVDLLPLCRLLNSTGLYGYDSVLQDPLQLLELSKR
jgi:hypothetical protein